MKAVLHYRASAGLLGMLRNVPPPWRIVAVDEHDKEGFMREIVDAQILLHVLEPVDAAMIAGGPQLRLIQKIGVGVNTIDLDACRAAGIAVANMPGTNTAAVAECALALMLGLLRQTRYLDSITRSGEGWSPDLATIDRIGEIGGRTIGLIGFGAVPRHLAPIVTAMGARVIFSNRTPRTHPNATQVSLEELLERSDIVSLHLPLVADTAKLIDAGALARMKPGALLVNCARGGLVDETALIAALTTGHLGGAGLDVFGDEPVAPDNPLLQLSNVLLSPHVAWLTSETLARSMAVAFENMNRVAAGREVLNRVA